MQGIYLNELGLKFVKTCLINYLGQIYFFGAFIVAIFWFTISKKKSLKYFSLYTLFLSLTVYNPFIVKLLFSRINQDAVYYRFFWLLPINIVVAYLITSYINRVSSFVKKLIMTFLIICTIIVLGSPEIYFSSLYQLPDNLYKVSDELLEISEYIHQDTDVENPRVAISSDLLMTIRQYDPSIILTIVRDRAICWQGAPSFQDMTADYLYQLEKPIMDVIYGGDTSNPDAFLNSMNSTATQYIVYSKSLEIQSFLQSFGYQYIIETDNYIIFKTC